eukprot:4336382-Amphidinium_carterae.1
MRSEAKGGVTSNTQVVSERTTRATQPQTKLCEEHAAEPSRGAGDQADQGPGSASQQDVGQELPESGAAAVQQAVAPLQRGSCTTAGVAQPVQDQTTSHEVLESKASKQNQRVKIQVVEAVGLRESDKAEVSGCSEVVCTCSVAGHGRELLRTSAGSGADICWNSEVARACVKSLPQILNALCQGASNFSLLSLCLLTRLEYCQSKELLWPVTEVVTDSVELNDILHFSVFEDDDDEPEVLGWVDLSPTQWQDGQGFQGQVALSESNTEHTAYLRLSIGRA